MRGWEGFFKSRKREYALVLAFFLLIAIIFTWPLILHIHNGVAGGEGDTLLNTWIISWDAKTAFTNPMGLFQANTMYPCRDVLVYSEHLFTLGILAAPVYYISGNPILSYNLLIYFAFVFSAFGCYLLVKELTGSRWGGLVGGIFFAFCPYKISKLGHIHIFFSPFLPFMLLYLYRFLDKGGRKNLILSGLFFLAQSLASWHYLVFCSLAAGLLWLWTAVFSRKREEWLRLAAVVVVLLIAAAAILPFTLPYLRARDRLPGFERELSLVSILSVDASDYLNVLPESLVYGNAPYPLRVLYHWPENMLFPGIIILFLALAGLFLRGGEESDLQVFNKELFRKRCLYFLILTLLGVIFTFGPEVGGVSNPIYMALYSLGIFKFIRVPPRFFILVALGLAVLGGCGVARLSAMESERRKSWKAGRLTAAVLVILLLVEMATFNLPVFQVPVWGEVPEVYSWLKEQGDVKIIELPVSSANWPRQALLVYYSTYHWKKTANGYSGYHPFFTGRIFSEIQGFPSERSVRLLGGLKIDYVIWHWNWVYPEGEEEYEDRFSSTSRLSSEQDFGDETVFRVETEELSSPEDLEVTTAVPTTIPPGEGFNIGLLVRNDTEAPMVIAEEDPQPFHVHFIDPLGNKAYEQNDDYRAPFFLDIGEETSLSLRVEGVPWEGVYRMELYLDNGVLGDRHFSLDIEVREPEDFAGNGILDGTVAPKDPLEVLDIPVPSGLFPIVFEIKNTGDELWRSQCEQGKAEGKAYPSYNVSLGVKWESDGEILGEEYDIMLPCDLSASQSVEVPTLIQTPDMPGRYRLSVWLEDENTGRFGDFAYLDVVVNNR